MYFKNFKRIFKGISFHKSKDKLSSFQFSNIEIFRTQHRTGKANSNSLSKNKLKYERQIEENQAICAAGPAMAEGIIFFNNLKVLLLQIQFETYLFQVK